MLTAGITAAVAGLLSLFGIKPGAYLVGVAIVVKLLIVALSLTVGSRLLKKRAAAKVEQQERQLAAAKTTPDPGRAGTG